VDRATVHGLHHGGPGAAAVPYAELGRTRGGAAVTAAGRNGSGQRRYGIVIKVVCWNIDGRIKPWNVLV